MNLRPRIAIAAMTLLTACEKLAPPSEELVITVVWWDLPDDASVPTLDVVPVDASTSPRYPAEL